MPMLLYLFANTSRSAPWALPLLLASEGAFGFRNVCYVRQESLLCVNVSKVSDGHVLMIIEMQKIAV